MKLPSTSGPHKFDQQNPVETGLSRGKSARLAWAITIGEAVLWGGLALALSIYWLMLPVWLRSLATLVLALLAAFGVLRVARFYRSRTRPRGGNDSAAPESNSRKASL